MVTSGMVHLGGGWGGGVLAMRRGNEVLMLRPPPPVSWAGQALQRDAEAVALEARLARLEEAGARARHEADEKTAEVVALKAQAREESAVIFALQS